MENKEFPEEELLREDPSFEEDALPDADLLLMDGVEPAVEPVPGEAPLPAEEIPAAEPVPAEEPAMSDEAFRAFMMMNAVPQEEPAAPVETEPVMAAEPVLPSGPVMADPEPVLPDEPVMADPLPVEDPLAPECDEEPDAFDRDLAEAEALMNGTALDEKFRDTEQATEEFRQMVEAEPAPTTVPAHERPVRKGRPRRKKGEGPRF